MYKKNSLSYFACMSLKTSRLWAPIFWWLAQALKRIIIDSIHTVVGNKTNLEIGFAKNIMDSKFGNKKIQDWACSPFWQIRTEDVKEKIRDPYMQVWSGNIVMRPFKRKWFITSSVMNHFLLASVNKRLKEQVRPIKPLNFQWSAIAIMIEKSSHGFITNASETPEEYDKGVGYRCKSLWKRSYVAFYGKNRMMRPYFPTITRYGLNWNSKKRTSPTRWEARERTLIQEGCMYVGHWGTRFLSVVINLDSRAQTSRLMTTV